MTRLQRAANAIHITTLALWAGAIAATALTAAIAFPAMKELDPTLPAVAADNAEHWRIAAGTVLHRVFEQSLRISPSFNTAATWLLTLSIATLIASVVPRTSPTIARTRRRALRIARPAAGAALLTAAIAASTLASDMSTLFEELQTAARAGDANAVRQLRARSDAIHDDSSVVVPALLAAIAAAITLAFLDHAPTTRPKNDHQDTAPTGA